jgi:enterochelin esterase-like enzyme
MQKVIVVAIYNTVDRREEYADSPKGRLYMRFIVDKLKPFIDQHYRTLPLPFMYGVNQSTANSAIAPTAI